MNRRLLSIQRALLILLVSAATVLLTGTGIIVPEDAALAPGDVVTIAVPEIGELTNHAQTIGAEH